jgi:hypothetical protein
LANEPYVVNRIPAGSLTWIGAQKRLEVYRQRLEELTMKKSVPVLVAAMLVFGSANALAGKHMASEKSGKPTAEECKKNPKMEGCATATKK